MKRVTFDVQVTVATETSIKRTVDEVSAMLEQISDEDTDVVRLENVYLYETPSEIEDAGKE